ncbi:MAG: Eco57I restriction-modification methylase domain-containing protein [Anaerolineales bacterium]
MPFMHQSHSELFAPHVSEGLESDPLPFETLIKGLYERGYTRYNFNAIDADVLGTVYEQYLGHIMAEPSAVLTTRRKQASLPSMDSEALTVVEKRQKRKSQGIYYTPTFVVKYIVQHTLGRYLAEHGYTPSQPVRVLDMACGSFLIEAFDALDRHVAQMRGQQSPATHLEGASQVHEVHDHARAIEILTGCLYGVDKDKQAADVARLNLMLRGLHARDRLPRLDNLRVGDSLISGSAEELEAAFGKEWKAKEPFNWEKEYPEVFAAGGFDVIVGNPPYVRIQTLPKDEVVFFNERYQAATGNYDIYVLFVERALQLLKSGGVLGLILPNKFMQVDYGMGLRRLLSSGQLVESIVDFKEFQIFEGATTYTCLLFLKKQTNAHFDLISVHDIAERTVDQIADAPTRRIETQILDSKAWVLADSGARDILEKLSANSQLLIDLPTDISRGSSSGADDVFILTTMRNGSYKTREGEVIQTEPEVLRIPIYATDFSRYHFHPLVEERIIFPYEVSRDGYTLAEEQQFKKDFPKAYKYLLGQRKRLEARKDFRQWFAFSAPRNLNVHDTANLVVPLLADRGRYAELPPKKNRYCLMASGGFSISISKANLSPHYILGLLNSALIFWNLKHISNVFRGGWITCTKQYVGQLPIHLINFADPAEKARHDHIVALVTEMLDLQKENAEAERRLDDKRHTLSRRIREVDEAIDRAVYQLYELTDDEIRVVEGR